MLLKMPFWQKQIPKTKLFCFRFQVLQNLRMGRESLTMITTQLLSVDLIGRDAFFLNKLCNLLMFDPPLDTDGVMLRVTLTLSSVS